MTTRALGATITASWNRTSPAMTNSPVMSMGPLGLIPLLSLCFKSLRFLHAWLSEMNMLSNSTSKPISYKLNGETFRELFFNYPHEKCIVVDISKVLVRPLS